MVSLFDQAQSASSNEKHFMELLMKLYPGQGTNKISV